jgi:hypothetical protein
MCDVVFKLTDIPHGLRKHNLDLWIVNAFNLPHSLQNRLFGLFNSHACDVNSTKRRSQRNVSCVFDEKLLLKERFDATSITYLNVKAITRFD